MNEQKISCEFKDTCGAYTPDCDDNYMDFDQESCYKPKNPQDCDICNQDVPLCCINKLNRLKNADKVLETTRKELVKLVEAGKSEGNQIDVYYVNEVIDAINEGLQSD